MSSLLEQAIIDATALKQAARKTAEKDLVEKYSSRIKEAVDKLLEQEEGLPDNAETETAPEDEAGNVPDDLEMDAGGEKIEQPEDPLKDVKASYLPTKDDDLITIDFSSLKAKPANNLQAGGTTLPMGAVPAIGAAAPVPVPAAPAAPASPEAAAPLQERYDAEAQEDDEAVSEEVEINLDDEDSDEEYPNPEDDTRTAGIYDEEPQPEDLGVEDDDQELDEESMCEMGSCGHPEHSDGTVVLSLGELEEAGAYTDGQDHLEPSGYEELDEDLLERMVVDMTPKSDGYRGMPDYEKRELQNVALAQQQDEEYQLKMKEYEEALDASEKRIKKAKKEKEVLMRENMELKDTLDALKEHLEKMNISNAKLLYTNRILGDNSFNERQKSQIVETISRTESVEGAKIAYETLQSAVQSVKTESKTPKSLNEAVSRSSSPFLVRPRIPQTNTYADRMKELAGIKK